MRKLERVLRVTLLVFGIFSFIGLGLNQWASFINAGKEVKILAAMEDKLTQPDDFGQEAAVLDCMIYGTIHAVVVDGKTYCYKFQGEIVASLEYLKENVAPKAVP